MEALTIVGLVSVATAIVFRSFLARLGEYLWQLIENKLAQRSVSQKDIELYEQIIELLPSHLMSFYKAQLFLSPFRDEYTAPLMRFVDQWNTPEHEFVDEGLEAARRRLYETASELAWTIARNTTLTRTGLRSVRPDHVPDGPIPDWVRRDAEEINERCPAFVDSHEQFVRLGRRKLYR